VRSAGPEAVHTSTFLGHPLACAAGLAVLGELDRLDFAAQAARIGSRVRARAEAWRLRFPIVSDVRGAGAMVGVALSRGAPQVVEKALARGVVLLTEGPAGDVLAFTPPLVIPATDLARALGIVEDCIAEVAS
jgi:4-aminobutyrate aminotransferase-like enzyme